MGCHLRIHQSGDPSYEQMIIIKNGQAWYDDLAKHKRDYVKVNREYYERQLEILQNKAERICG